MERGCNGMCVFFFDSIATLRRYTPGIIFSAVWKSWIMGFTMEWVTGNLTGMGYGFMETYEIGIIRTRVVFERANYYACLSCICGDREGDRSS